LRFSKFLKHKAVIGAFFMAIFYQIIMVGSFIPGYSAIPKNTDKLPISIVNDDAQYGKTIQTQLKKELPFKDINTKQTLKESKKSLNDRDVQLIIHIPKDFTAKLQQGKENPKINFYVNEANPAVVTSTLNIVVDRIGGQLNQQFSESKAKGIFASLNVPEKQADAFAKSVGNSLDTNLVSINKVPDGMHNQMAPMFITMVSYVGAMIASMMLAGAFQAAKTKVSKWKAYGYMQLSTVLLAIIAPVVGLAIVYLVQGYGGETFMQLWGHHALQMFVSLQFTLIFSFLLGQVGMLVNMPLLLIQTIAGGAVMTREMMYWIFEKISYISPMYYSIQADFSILFGGGKLSVYEWQLACVGIVALLINTLTAAFRYKNTQPVQQTDSVAS